ncbi:MAG: hypothetical protein IKR81_10110 [Victivallales bacterium]|jgi:hypothetical protein|nr:hypothetical protein [Victivallales bacterium]
MEEDSPRMNVIAELRASLTSLDAGEGLSSFVEGHGLQSQLFRFSWSEPTLSIDLELPYACVLEDEEEQAADDAEIAASIRMAILLMVAAGSGTLLLDGEGRLAVFHDGDSLGWAVYDVEGNLLDDAEDWETLVARLENAVPNNAENAVTIIWP